MKLSAKTEYGCLALLHLAERHALGEPVQIRKVASEHDIPWRFLVQILLELKRAGLVNSTRGAAGGYRLARPPEEIDLAEVTDALEGTDEPTCRPASGFRSAVYSACQEAHEAHREHLASLSLVDLLERAGGKHEPMWYI
ncbi:MAG: RrF2 family transcriptional regulator [Aeoliella sp.]